MVGDVNQLQPLAFMEAAQKAKVPVTFRSRGGARIEATRLDLKVLRAEIAGESASKPGFRCGRGR